ncbi:MAG: gluconate 2-dehydrogenase gamma chain [Paraglaciecola sp.]
MKQFLKENNGKRHFLDTRLIMSRYLPSFFKYIKMKRRDAIKRTTFILGAGLSASTLVGLLAGCQPDGKNNADAAMDWQPAFFDKNQWQLLAEVTERIVPATDTPGAKDVGVPQFIDTMLAEYYPKADQQKIVNGLKQIEAAAQKAHKKSFVELDGEQMDKILMIFDQEAADVASKMGKRDGEEAKKRVNKYNALPYDVNNKESNKPTHFFRMVKEMTLSGFFLSEAGATEVLQYEPVPGEYNGCMPLSEIGVAYAV